MPEWLRWAVAALAATALLVGAGVGLGLGALTALVLNGEVD